MNFRQSIREHGVLQPILVRRSNQEGRYVIVMGARRYRAASACRVTGNPGIFAGGRRAGSIRADDREHPARRFACTRDRRIRRGPSGRRRHPGRNFAQTRQAKRLGVAVTLRFKACQNFFGRGLRARRSARSMNSTRLGAPIQTAIERLCAAQESFTDAQARQLARDVTRRVRRLQCAEPIGC